MPNPSTPHDAVFRRILSTPSNAASHLRATLPTALTTRLNLDQLVLVPGSLIDATLRWRHTDLLFTVPLDGRTAFVYILIEHQSSNDPLMAFRMLRYVIRIWDRHLGDHPTTTRLPAVLPLVVHHNEQAWTAPLEVADLIDLDDHDRAAGWKDHLPRFRFLLDDLVRIDERQLRQRPLTHATRLTLLLLKIAPGNPQLASDLQPWVDELRAVLAGPDGKEEFTALLRYIDLVGDADTHDQLHDLMTAVGPDAEEAYMTIAETLKAEGRAEGRAETLLQLLALKFGPLPEPVLTTVRNASIDKLQAWTARVLTTDSLNKLLD
ncbi:Rpn family recombination-promoting nuclease/putative transposase [Frankia sp. CIT1]|uniref:Rpn family recombination-promoting nuclease/putative transposase n=1 Tax=Frankia sp. CIT1 TaxID=2880974 RepID=UPI001EF4B6FB|nr:Rpn family recombination-promoting nuclease/putative transposase [Frankia sp. CIT1]